MQGYSYIIAQQQQYGSLNQTPAGEPYEATVPVHERYHRAIHDWGGRAGQEVAYDSELPPDLQVQRHDIQDDVQAMMISRISDRIDRSNSGDRPRSKTPPRSMSPLRSSDPEVATDIDEPRPSRSKEDALERAINRAFNAEIKELAEMAQDELQHLQNFVQKDKIILLRKLVQLAMEGPESCLPQSHKQKPPAEEFGVL